MTSHPFISVAPLMGVTHFYFHYFCRLLTRTSLLHTEMLVDKMVTRVHAARSSVPALRLLPHYLPLHVQLGGNSAVELIPAARLSLAAGFSGININAGWYVLLSYEE